jgi:hypothetical protein
LSSIIRETRWHVAHRLSVKHSAVVKLQNTEACIADARNVGQDCVEYQLQVAGLGADDAQHIGGSGLLFECFAEFGGAFAQPYRDTEAR